MQVYIYVPNKNKDRIIQQLEVDWGSRIGHKGFAAEKEYHRKTKRLNEMWVTDYSYLRELDRTKSAE